MYLQHFGLTHAPLGKKSKTLWDNGQIEKLKTRFQWLLDSPGIVVLTAVRIPFKPPGQNTLNRQAKTLKAPGQNISKRQLEPDKQFPDNATANLDGHGLAP